MKKTNKQFQVAKTTFWILFVAALLTMVAINLNLEKESETKIYISEVLTQEFEKTNGFKPAVKDGVLVASSIEKFYLGDISKEEFERNMAQLNDSTKNYWIKTIQEFDNKQFNKKVTTVLKKYNNGKNK